jgi:hypothetical protein
MVSSIQDFLAVFFNVLLISLQRNASILAAKSEGKMSLVVRYLDLRGRIILKLMLKNCEVD